MQTAMMLFGDVDGALVFALFCSSSPSPLVMMMIIYSYIFNISTLTWQQPLFCLIIIIIFFSDFLDIISSTLVCNIAYKIFSFTPFLCSFNSRKLFFNKYSSLYFNLTLLYWLMQSARNVQFKNYKENPKIGWTTFQTV